MWKKHYGMEGYQSTSEESASLLIMFIFTVCQENIWSLTVLQLSEQSSG